MSTPENNDPLDALLREPEPYIDDAGFTARVMASLPPRRSSRLRPAILCVAMLLGLALLVWWMPALKDVVNVDADEISLNFSAAALMQVCALIVGAGSIVWSFFSMINSEE